MGEPNTTSLVVRTVRTSDSGKDGGISPLLVVSTIVLLLYLCACAVCVWCCCWCSCCGTPTVVRAAIEAQLQRMAQNGALPRLNDRPPEPGMRVLPGQQVGDVVEFGTVLGKGTRV
mmetsp:Transcript_16229/g.41979  ORF Transcript_16229/g.41979 Transcript_16229/m.41979 type:complete len:116 (-) Transcript_16229:237-584(-)